MNRYICPHCGSREFITDRILTSRWAVNSCGEFTESASDLYFEHPDLIANSMLMWSCKKCKSQFCGKDAEESAIEEKILNEVNKMSNGIYTYHRIGTNDQGCNQIVVRLNGESYDIVVLKENMGIEPIMFFSNVEKNMIGKKIIEILKILDESPDILYLDFLLSAIIAQLDEGKQKAIVSLNNGRYIIVYRDVVVYRAQDEKLFYAELGYATNELNREYESIDFHGTSIHGRVHGHDIKELIEQLIKLNRRRPRP